MQLGLQYGIANKKGALNDEEVQEILNYAWQNGITSFDTAPAYGESERRIGNFVERLLVQNTNKLPTIITKIPALSEEIQSGKTL